MQSLAHQFLTFCRSKPADERYNPWDTKGCAIFRFLSEAGYPVGDAGVTRWYDTEGRAHPTGVAHGIIGPSPRTFGALADRLEASLGEGL